MPISPSYRAKQAPRFKPTGVGAGAAAPTGGSGGTISTAGTYIPPKPASGSPPLLTSAVGGGYSISTFIVVLSYFFCVVI